MRKITCDRCGEVLTPEMYENTGYISMGWRGYYGADIHGVNPLENCDFCEECMEEIKAFINTPKIRPEAVEADADKSTDEAPPAEADGAGQDPEEPKKPKRKYTRLDSELLRSYASQGLTYKEIQERLYSEHGIICSRQTVANHLQKVGF